MPPSPKETFSEEEKASLTEEELAHLDDDLGDDVEVDEESLAALKDVADAEKAAADKAAADKAAADATAKVQADKDAADVATKKAADDLAAQKAAADAGDEAAKQAIADAEKAAADKAAADKAAADKAEADRVAAAAPATAITERTPKMVRRDLEKLNTELDELAAKFDDAEITAVEKRAAERKIEAQKLDLSIELGDVTASEKKWGTETVKKWLDEHHGYREDAALMTQLDEIVRAEQVRTGRQYDVAFLDKAHEKLAPKITAKEEAIVRRALGLGPDDPLPVKKGATAAAAAVKDPATREIPPSLRTVPAASMSDTGDGSKFAALDRLADKDPLAYEDALAKMTDADREQYLAQ